LEKSNIKPGPVSMLHDMVTFCRKLPKEKPSCGIFEVIGGAKFDFMHDSGGFFSFAHDSGGGFEDLGLVPEFRPIPEPSLFLLLGGGRTGSAFVARRRKKA